MKILKIVKLWSPDELVGTTIKTKAHWQDSVNSVEAGGWRTLSKQNYVTSLGIGESKYQTREEASNSITTQVELPV